MPFLKLVKKYYHQPDIATTEAFREKVKAGINWKEVEEEDVFFMCFFAWLKSKMQQTDLYETTLKVVNNE